MSGTATIVWTNPVPSNQQELYYGKDALVTGLPGSGGGWIADPNNPLSGSTGSETITNLDDNVKYDFLVRGDCSNTTDIYSRSSAIKWVCGAIQTQGPVNGTLSYTLNVDPSVSNAGSAVGRLVIILQGTDINNASVVYATKTYTAPFSASYTDQFTGVIGDMSWTISVGYQSANYPYTQLYTCSSTQFTTSNAQGVTLVHVRNGLALGTLSQLVISSTSVLPNTLDAGNGANINISTLVTTASPVQIQCTMPDVSLGKQLFARQVRGGIQVAGGVFTYTGSSSNISSVPWSLQNGDIIELVDAGTTGYIFRQPILTKATSPSNGYNVHVSIDVPQGADTHLTVSASEYDYSSGTSLPITTGTITIPQGSLSISTFVASALTSDKFSRSTLTNLGVITGTTSIAVPYYYIPT